MHYMEFPLCNTKIVYCFVRLFSQTLHNINCQLVKKIYRISYFDLQGRNIHLLNLQPADKME